MQNLKARRLRERLARGGILRIMGAHNGLGSRIIEATGFDAVWASGLEISTAFAVPDANLLTMTDNLQAAVAMNEACGLPVVCDCDTGYGNANNARYMVRKYDAAGLAAAVIEDKLFPKVNSFVPGRQDLADIAEFCGKIEAAKNAQKSADFMVFARIEALIAGQGMDEALERARAYERSGADGIVIHSKLDQPDEIFEFARRFNSKLPLVAIPTTYYRVTETELEKAGFRIVIYANQGLRASIRAMKETLSVIRKEGTTASIENQIASMKDVFDLQGMKGFKEDEKRFIPSTTKSVRAIIPAAGDPRKSTDLGKTLAGKPLCMLEIGGKTMLERQTETLRSAGVNEIVLIAGYAADQIPNGNFQRVMNPDFETSHSAFSLMKAESHFADGFLLLFADILFDKRIVQELLESPHDLTLVVDRAWKNLPRRNKRHDLAVIQAPSSREGRNLDASAFTLLQKIGKRFPGEEANAEFIGMAYVKSAAAIALKDVWRRVQADYHGRSFHEAASAREADLTDLFQHVLDLGFPVHVMDIDRGWSEVHSSEDVRRLEKHFQPVAA